MKKLVLLDAHALLHRAYHALPEFTNSQGVPTGGLYGYTSMIFRIATDLKPDYIVACYDLPQKTFRHEAYDAYKGHRAKTDTALVDQITSSRVLCEKLNIPIYDLAGFEADDMLGTIVEQMKQEKNLEIIIATGDMDSLQLVTGKKVRVFTLKKGMNDTVIYDEDAVNERYGFGPEFLTDYKGLRGDPSDNIIGVPGIGEKTATEIILKFGSIENVYSILHSDRNTLIKEGIKERIVGLLEEHEESALFSKTLATIRRDAPIHFALPEKTWKDGFEVEAAEVFLRDYEFKSLITRLKNIVGVTPQSSQGLGQLPLSEEQDSPLLEVSQEMKIAMWLLNSENANATTEDVLHYTRTKNLIGAQQKLEEEIKESSLGFVYESIELPLIPILKKMQQHGVLVDKKYLLDLSQEFHEQLKKYEAKIYTHVGHEFNINSPKQLGEILFGEMNIQANIKGFKVKKTASGTYSTRESDLEKLVDVHPIIADIFEYRELQKLLSTYVDNIPEMLDDQSRLHPELLQMGAATGRFSCQNPNIQNIPIRGEQGKRLRNAFIAPSDSVLIAADYSQIELRSAAILSGDPILIETFKQNKDIHTSVASRVFHVDEAEVTGDMRRKAKVINFGILYGMGVTALQKNLGTDRKEAQAFYDEYFKQMTGLSQYIDYTIMTAKKKGYTETLFGRRRSFPGLQSKIPFVKAMAERAASNAPIQGTTADIIKLAMIELDKAITHQGVSDKIAMTMQIHDELVFEVKKDFIDQAEKLITETMEGVLELSPRPIENKVPITISVAHGSNWGAAKD
ncbi:MAG: DNA polymerase [bacterium]